MSKLLNIFQNDAIRLYVTVNNVFTNAEHKGRITALVVKDEQMCIIKWNHPDNIVHLSNLQKETDYYRQHQGSGHIVPLIYEENNLFIIERFEGLTLRQWLIDYVKNIQCLADNTDLDTCIITITKTLSAMYRGHKKYIIKEDITTEKVAGNLVGIFHRLCTSHPSDVTHKKMERRLLLFADMLLRPVVRSIVNKAINKATLKNTITIIHGDLHLNNILISQDCTEAKIIDFENIMSGSVLSDLLYVYSFMYRLLACLPEPNAHISIDILQKHFSGFLAQDFPEIHDTFFNISKIMLAGVSTNRAFGYNDSVSGLIISFLLLPVRLLCIWLRRGRWKHKRARKRKYLRLFAMLF